MDSMNEWMNEQLLGALGHLADMWCQTLLLKYVECLILSCLKNVSFCSILVCSHLYYTIESWHHHKGSAGHYDQDNGVPATQSR